MPRARRRHTVKVSLSAEEYAVVESRAAAHRRRVAVWARSVMLGEQGRAVKDADEWGDSLPPTRRAQVHRWVDAARATADPIPGQLTIEESAP